MINCRFFRVLLPIFMLFALLPAFGSAASSGLSALTVGIAATPDVQLRPLELNQRDMVSVLDMVYEGLFTIDDNYQPQPELAYSYSFISNNQRLEVILRDDVTFHNGKKLNAYDVAATLDYMYELSGFDRDLNSEVELTERGLYYSTFYSIKSWEVTDERTILPHPPRRGSPQRNALRYRPVQV